MKTAILYFMVFNLFMGCNSDESKSQRNDLVGKWKLVAFVDEKNGTILTEDDFENSNEITITFYEDFNYEGNTVRNTFGSEYSINSSATVLIFKKGGWVTEAGETEWGYFFFDKLILTYDPATGNTSYNYELLGDVLKVYYADKEYMEFVKIEP